MNRALVYCMSGRAQALPVFFSVSGRKIPTNVSLHRVTFYCQQEENGVFLLRWRRRSCSQTRRGSGENDHRVNLGAYMAQAGKRVLLVDSIRRAIPRAPWAHSGTSRESTTHHGQGFRERGGPGLFHPEPSIIPSSIDSRCNHRAGGPAGEEYFLKKALAPWQTARLYFIDCPPSLGLLTLNGLVAADFVIIRCSASTCPGRLSLLMKTVNRVQKA